MKCETCQDRGFTEQEHGLIMVLCDCDKAREIAKREDIPLIIEGTEAIEATYTGLLFQLAGKRTNEFTIDELWGKAKEAGLEKMEFPYIIEMPCGEAGRINTPYSILNLEVKDIPCPCGNPNHYIVRFSDDREASKELMEALKNGDSIIRAERDNQLIGSTDTSKPKRTHKPKAQKTSRRRTS
ncbi:MAG: hypothetical protein KAS32_21020 [Candidatus Peribacteraceae bacterium]|nr:hypothetical protein [Candidatus Peribacteraceae bacterium]